MEVERDIMAHAWPKDEVSVWDVGKLSRLLCKSVEAWGAYKFDADTILEEAAGTLKDLLEELDSRDESTVVTEEEASAVGENATSPC
jgi:hypothetical protein